MVLISKKMLLFQVLFKTKGEDRCAPSSSLEIVTIEVFSNFHENSTSLFSSTFSYVTSCSFLKTKRLGLLGFIKLSLASKLFIKHVQLPQLSFIKIGKVCPNFTVVLK
jgi:hypothetical protein